MQIRSLHLQVIIHSGQFNTTAFEALLLNATNNGIVYGGSMSFAEMGNDASPAGLERQPREPPRQTRTATTIVDRATHAIADTDATDLTP